MSQTKAQLLDPTGVFTLTDQLIGVGATFSANIRAVDGIFSGNVSVAGTLTKEDVTNVDSVGLITARAGINITGGALDLGDGNITNVGEISLDKVKPDNGANLSINMGTDKNIMFSGSIGEIGSVTGFQATNDAANANTDFGIRATSIRFATGSSERLRIQSDGKVGINTVSPGSPLEVNGGSALDTATFNSHHAQGLLINLQRSGTNTGYLGSGKNIADATGGVDDIGLRAQANLIFTTGGGTERLRITSVGNVGINTTSPAANLEISGNQIGNAVAISGTAIDCSLGNYYTKTITGATAFTFSNVPASGKEYSLTIELTLNGSNAVTWPAAVKWPGDAAPAITDAKTQLFMLVTRDGGTKWRGSSLVDYTT